MTNVMKDRFSNNPLTALNHLQYEHLMAGVSGGLTSTLILHPLDLIKIRLAVNDGTTTHGTPRYTGIKHAFLTIYNQEGFRGLYRGVVPNLWGAGASWGLYFFFYNSIKTWTQDGDIQKPLSPHIHLMAASEAGVLTLFITNPLWVLKTRMCLQYSDPNIGKSNQVYTGMLNAFKVIYKNEGLKGYYRGFVPGIFGVSHGAVQFMAYEEMKNQYNHYKQVPITTKLKTVEYLTFAAISKVIAAATTYPYQVVRARLQNQHYTYNGVIDCATKTWNFEGWKGFYKGLGTNLLRVTPATMITFVTYENISHILLNNKFVIR